MSCWPHSQHQIWPLSWASCRTLPQKDILLSLSPAAFIVAPSAPILASVCQGLVFVIPTRRVNTARKTEVRSSPLSVPPLPFVGFPKQTGCSLSFYSEQHRADSDHHRGCCWLCGAGASHSSLLVGFVHRPVDDGIQEEEPKA